MHSVETLVAGKQDISQLHAATCLLMTRFINGHHCPKLAHVIVHQLQQLLAHPQQTPDSREMYLKLLEHWQSVCSGLLEQKQPEQPNYRYH